MNIIIRNTGEAPIYEQIVVQIKNAILSGELAEGEPLPSIRLLAKELRISVITTKRAYEELERDGFIVTMSGKGSFVAPQNLELLREEQRRALEQHLTQAVAAAKAAGISRQELTELLALLYEDEPEEDGGGYPQG
ncbi:MAG TPA: GntR family transcriptional regulator [Firmicutes bacterium]|nr:GntR family transcriptional regulator [Bacillota bacterium]